MAGVKGFKTLKTCLNKPIIILGCLVQISLSTENIFVVRQAFARFQHGFFGSAENVDLHNFIDGIWENDFLHNITNMVYVFL